MRFALLALVILIGCYTFAAAQETKTGVIQPPPGPDPSTLTQEEIRRVKQEILATVKDEIAALNSILVTRLDASDKATILLSDDVHRVPTLLDRSTEEIEKEFVHVAALFDEKIKRLEAIGSLTKQDSADSLQLALNAAKEGVAQARSASDAAAEKSTGTFAKQISDLQELIRLYTGNANDKIAGLTDRLTKMESLVSSVNAAYGSVAGFGDRLTKMESAISSLNASYGSLAGLGDRLTKIESAIAAVSASKGDTRSDNGLLISLLALGLSLLGLLVMIFVAIDGRRPRPSAEKA